MDPSVFWLIVLVLIIVLVYIVVRLYTQSETDIDLGPFKFRVKGKRGESKSSSDESEPSSNAAIVGRDLKSEQGGLSARDESGGGIEIERVKVKKDIDLHTSGPRPDPNP